uniref:UPF0193 protein EVG1 homolog n=1 Tax=Steinernema glaseri TaxID=37863 RepID=A0A1I7Z715_9BILA
MQYKKRARQGHEQRQKIPKDATLYSGHGKHETNRVTPKNSIKLMIEEMTEGQESVEAPKSVPFTPREIPGKPTSRRVHNQSGPVVRRLSNVTPQVLGDPADAYAVARSLQIEIRTEEKSKQRFDQRTKPIGRAPQFDSY